MNIVTELIKQQFKDSDDFEANKISVEFLQRWWIIKLYDWYYN